jgi:signal peptidase I
MQWDYRKFISLFVLATGIALGVRLFIVESYRITTDSMKPALLTGDMVLASKLVYNFHLPFSNFEIFRLRSPLPGEVVAFALPDEGLKVFVKRVVATEGDTVEIKDGKLWINSVAAKYSTQNGMEEETLANGTTHFIDWDRQQTKPFGPVDVPKDHFFALGDNRGASIDSRSWGPVPKSCLKGKAKWVWISKEPQSWLRLARTLNSIE